jgi:hypothetical protein
MVLDKIGIGIGTWIAGFGLLNTPGPVDVKMLFLPPFSSF